MSDDDEGVQDVLAAAPWQKLLIMQQKLAQPLKAARGFGDLRFSLQPKF